MGSKSLVEPKVIQVFSPSRGGSTFLGFMLSNGEEAITTGDVWSMFRSEKPKHGTNCMCGDPDCSIWKEAKEKGEEGFYELLIDKGFNLVVDTSKELSWYESQKNYFGGVIKETLIFKDPLEQAYSFWKRRKIIGLDYYIDYYLRALTITSDPLVIEYKDLATRPGRMLRSICEGVGIEYFPGKEKFWELSNWHTWGGSNTAQIHFFNKDSKKYKEIEKRLLETQKRKPSVLDHHREIYYSHPGNKLPISIREKIKRNRHAWNLYRFLRSMKV